MGAAKLMRFIPRSVMVGFVNALAILIFIAQIPQLIGVPWLVYPLAAVGIILLIVMPKVTKVVPGPLVVIVLLTAIVVLFPSLCPRSATKASCREACPNYSSRTCHLPGRHSPSSLRTPWAWPPWGSWSH